MQFIGTELDKNSNSVNFYQLLGKHCNAELSSFLLSKYAAMVKLGHCSPSYVPTIRDKRIIYAAVNGETAGIMLWIVSANSAFIEFTVVDEKYQQRGIYNLLHKKFDEIMVKEKIRFSRSSMHIKNTNVIEASKKNGYHIEYLRMIKEHVGP